MSGEMLVLRAEQRNGLHRFAGGDRKAISSRGVGYK